MVSDETVIDLKTTASLLDYSRNPELKALLDRYDVVDIEVRKKLDEDIETIYQ